MAKILRSRRYSPTRRDASRHWLFIAVLLLLALSVAVGALAHQHPEREGKLVGPVQALPASGLVGDWTVAGVVVHVLPTTVIEQEKGPVQVGALVKVEGTFQADHSLLASKVEVLANPGGVQPPAMGKVFGVLKLLPTPAAPVAAEGVVVVRAFTAGGTVLREDLKVGVEHLLPQQTYDVFVDGVHAGAILTNGEGEGHLFLSSAPIPGAEPLPPELSPVTQRQQVEVRQANTVVLFGDFANARWDGDGSAAREYLAVAPLAGGNGVILGLGVAEIKQGEQQLKVTAFLLPPLVPVTVVADQVVLGTLQTQANGLLHGEFSTSPEGHDVPLPGDALPVSGWQTLELRAADGSLLASGSFQSLPHPGTPTAPGQVRRNLGKPKP